ncbi:hypothetical protein CRUP_035358, partial [Coryphaenoides rupestris]
MSHVENLLERVRQQHAHPGPPSHRHSHCLSEPRRMSWGRGWDARQGPGYDQVPWSDLLLMCIDHKLQDWPSPGTPICQGGVSQTGMHRASTAQRSHARCLAEFQPGQGTRWRVSGKENSPGGKERASSFGEDSASARCASTALYRQTTGPGARRAGQPRTAPAAGACSRPWKWRAEPRLHKLVQRLQERGRAAAVRASSQRIAWLAQVAGAVAVGSGHQHHQRQRTVPRPGLLKLLELQQGREQGHILVVLPSRRAGQGGEDQQQSS